MMSDAGEEEEEGEKQLPTPLQRLVNTKKTAAPAEEITQIKATI